MSAFKSLDACGGLHQRIAQRKVYGIASRTERWKPPLQFFATTGYAYAQIQTLAITI
ncbi:MAG: hypothetical protein V7L29_10580 [Nostoc sp.]|uniref:hypothetical protein n=1 Tax=Nostoc sp. TaxID=1180 RepID=UPI002FF52082